MTTETSNARGEVVAWEARDPDDGTRWVTRHASERDGWMGLGRTIRPLIYGDAPPPAAARGDVPYDRDLIARMLYEAVPYLREYYRPDSMREQARLLREADNAAVANVGTVAERGDVRGLVAKWQECGCGFSDPMGGYESCPECGEALAAEGVQAGEVDARQMERSALVAWEAISKTLTETVPGWNTPDGTCQMDRACAAIRLLAGLSQQPEARGVVGEGSRIVTSQLLHWGGIPVYVTGTVTTSPGNWPLIDAALTEARNVR